jgi:DNA polymerase-3 subunit gamma/tau
VADQALYRKYRSQDFAAVVGQDHVVKTLTAQVASGRTGHAYLFTGPRGTGKTSVARLLARALNCTGSPKPCNQCSNCLAALQSSLDVIEMDAASNRSIDAIRDLRDKINLAPSQGAFKVYIIDEVHMLTTEAFNALLKTLEEPPAHAVFILATTEAHKVPDTIISRTQRFNFHPIRDEAIAAHLATIASSENIAIEPEALAVIAQAARGGFRDAISLLDQVGSLDLHPIAAEDVRQVLGYSPEEEITALCQAIAERQTAKAFEILGRLEQAGSQPSQIAVQLVYYWRTVLMATLGRLPSPAPVVQALAQSVPPARATVIIETFLEIGRSHWPQLALETAVAKLSSEPEATTPARRASVHAQAPAPTKPNVASPAATPPPAPVPTNTSAEAPNPPKAELWPKVLVLLKAEHNSLSALLQMYPVDFAQDEITLKPRFNFHRDLFMKPTNRSAIEKAVTKVYGHRIKISARTEETSPKTKRSPADPSAELVSSALEILGGEIVD